MHFVRLLHFIFMKTNQNMVRRVGEFEVYQRTKDGYFDSSSLLLKWNSVKSNTNKSVADFLRLKNTIEFIETLEKDKESHVEKSQDGQYQAVRLVKGRNTKKGKTKET